MVIPGFYFAKFPEIYFGPGKFKELPKLLTGFGTRILIVCGQNSFANTPKAVALAKCLQDQGIEYAQIVVSGEPTPELVDTTVAEYQDARINAVVGIGGGSALDAAKAIAAMMHEPGSVVEYLEGIGKRTHSGNRLGLIAIPTTAGTGSEATKNAVLSRIGEHGFKRSLRHDHFIPDIAIVDPELMLTCPANVTAACGMDALTQLLEAFVSTKANPMTDALAFSGIEYLIPSLVQAFENGQDLAARTNMAYAALLSGITLANAGLGIVHGFAASIGGFFNIQHGVICGTLVNAATRVNIMELQKLKDASASLYLSKYARVGALMAGQSYDATKLNFYLDCLLQRLDHWCAQLQLPKLGIEKKDIPKILSETGNKNNPVPLSPDAMAMILTMRML